MIFGKVKKFDYFVKRVCVSKHLERELIGIASWIRTSLIVSDKNFLGQYAQLLEFDQR